MPSPAGLQERRIRGLARNLPLLSAFRALQMALLPVAIVPLFWRDELDFGMVEIFGLQALFGFFTACLEFPAGYLADRIGYRRALAIGTFSSIIGWLVLGSANGFAMAAWGELFLAVSLSLSSGTDSALLYESCVEIGREEDFGRWFGRSRSIGAFSEGTAALLAGILYSLWPPLPFFLQALLWLFNAGIVFSLTEPRRHPSATQPVLKQMRGLIRFAAVESPRLRASILTVVLIGLSTFIPVWMLAIYAEGAGVPVTWIGPIWAAANYAVAIGLWAGDGSGRRLGEMGTLLLCTLLIGGGLLGMGLNHATWGFIFYFAICLGRGLNAPILNHLQQRLIPSADRASLLSINSLLFRGSFFMIGPLLGLGIDRFGEHPVLLAAAALATPLCLAAILHLASQLRDPEATAGKTPSSA